MTDEEAWQELKRLVALPVLLADDTAAVRHLAARLGVEVRIERAYLKPNEPLSWEEVPGDESHHL